jgi:hypothetical protein
MASSKAESVTRASTPITSLQKRLSASEEALHRSRELLAETERMLPFDGIRNSLRNRDGGRHV